ncbi:hypothetical protein HG530_011451 [Fusarium avenaceum]|nr:hypothetical protein HG530_011451 [Fusarium avenaceum]
MSLKEVAGTSRPVAVGSLAGNLSSDDLLNGDTLAVESGIGILALDHNGTIDLNTCVKATRLDVRKDRLKTASAQAAAVLLLVCLGLQVLAVLSGPGRLGRSLLILGLLGLLSVHSSTDLDGTSSAVGTSNDSKIAAQGNACLGKSVKCFSTVDDTDTVVNVKSDHEARTHRVHLDT